MLPKIVVLLALIATTLAGKLPFYDTEVYRQGNGRIVGGTTATPGQFPYQVSLRQPVNFHFCGGSIVSEHWIITAGHCTYNRTPDAVVAVIGVQNINVGGTSMAVSQLVTHDGFDINLFTNDIAMVQTTDAIVFTLTVQLIGIGTPDEIGGGVAAITSGWGSTSYEGPAPAELQFLDVTTLTQDDCRTQLQEFASFAYDNTICALGQNGTGTCQGDSGGPLVANGQLIGATSWGINCALGYPDGYARISSYNTWILQTLSS